MCSLTGSRDMLLRNILGLSEIMFGTYTSEITSGVI